MQPFKTLTNWVKNLFKPHAQEPRKIIRSEHTLSRKSISRAALNILYRLNRAGFQAYLVGGGVRDLLLDGHPKDFDIVTNARPEQIKRLFRQKCLLIGRRFRLAHIFSGRDYIEVATFRAAPKTHSNDKTDVAMLVRDNVYGDIDQDAWRRDFTVNALYYNISDFSIIDYVQGFEDLKKRQIRMIGDPSIRYQEDPVRMLRAVRFTAKLNFHMEAQTESKILEYRHLLDQVSPNRLFDEFCKLFLTGNAVNSFKLLEHYQLFEKLFPVPAGLLNPETSENHPSSFSARRLADQVRALIQCALENTDRRYHAQLSLLPAFLIAIFFWRAARSESKRSRLLQLSNLLKIQNKTLQIPKKCQAQIEEIYRLQSFLQHYQKYSSEMIQDIFYSGYFRMAFDFLVIRYEAGESHLKQVVLFWRDWAHHPQPAQKIENIDRTQDFQDSQDSQDSQDFNHS
jgi:poly(A) polymerase